MQRVSIGIKFEIFHDIFQFLKALNCQFQFVIDQFLHEHVELFAEILFDVCVRATGCFVPHFTVVICLNARQRAIRYALGRCFNGFAQSVQFANQLDVIGLLQLAYSVLALGDEFPQQETYGDQNKYVIFYFISCNGHGGLSSLNCNHRCVTTVGQLCAIVAIDE